MRIVRQIHAPARYVANEPVRAAFFQYCGQFGLPQVKAGDWYVVIDEGDERLDGLLAILAAHGMTLRPDLPLTASLIGVAGMAAREEEARRYVHWSRQRIYEGADLEACEYLILFPKFSVVNDDEWVRVAERVEITGPEVPAVMREHRIVHTRLDSLLMSDAAKGIIEPLASGSRFRAVHFRVESDPPIWWEVETEPMLPPLSDTMQIVDRDGRPVTRGDVSRGPVRPLSPDGVRPVEHRYRRGDLDSIGPFDMALTFEPLGRRIGPDGSRSGRRIVSQRLYRTVRDAGFADDIHWTPVRIDEG
jgi:hypothetical protein